DIRGELDSLVAKGRYDEGKARFLASIVRGTTGYADFAGCDLVLEAVFEELSVKKDVFGELERVVSPETILATNTSSLSVTDMAADLRNPERVVGMHFFNPVALMPLLELVRAEQTGADEIHRLLEEGVVAEAADVDTALLLGAGWPFFLGGITRYLDQTGTSERAVGERFDERRTALV